MHHPITISVPASDVAAAALDKGRFKTNEEMIKQLWKKNQPDTFPASEALEFEVGEELGGNDTGRAMDVIRQAITEVKKRSTSAKHSTSIMAEAAKKVLCMYV